MEKSILSDEEIIKLFFERNNRAIQALSIAYGLYLKSIASNVLKNSEDCDECLNDVYFSLWNHIPPEKPNNLRAYASKAVRNAALRMKQTRASNEALPIDELADYLESPQNVELEYDAIELKNILNQYVRSLSAKNRYIFICRYYDNDSIAAIARSLHVSETTVFKRLAKMRTGLRARLRNEGFPC